MSDYIFKPPPPPPPKASAAPANQNQTQNQWGNTSRGRGGRDNTRGRGRGGRGNHNRGGYGAPGDGNRSHCVPPQSAHQHLASQSPAPAPHLNPAFFPQLAPPPSQLPPRPPLQSISVSPSNPFFPQWTDTHQSQPFVPPAQPALRSYSDLSPPSAPNSYGHFSTNVTAATTPIARSSSSSRPDMSHEQWLALNGGKLLGTNIKPPETEEEIAAWIAERKARFPSAKRREEKAKEEEEKAAKRRAQLEAVAKEQETRKQKRKREEDDAGSGSGSGSDEDEDDDAPPEEISAHTRTVFRDDRKKQQPQTRKAAEECRAFRKTGKCPRGEECKYKHTERRDKKPKAANPRKEEKTRPSLYQRLVDKEMERENEVMLQVIKYLVETGAIKDEVPRQEEVNEGVDGPEDAIHNLVEEIEDQQEEQGLGEQGLELSMIE